MIFDCGTGARGLGNLLSAPSDPSTLPSAAPSDPSTAPSAPTASANAAAVVDADIFLSHTHLDHICGLPFFLPAYRADNTLRIWAGHLAPETPVRDVIGAMMVAPLFPVPMDSLKADIGYHDFRAGETLAPRPGITLRTTALNHPDGATGYRIEYGGKSICYVTDTEHVPGAPDANILGLIDGADMVIYDATYTDEEFPRYQGWGHSTWQEGARLCDAAGVKAYVIFHHDPGHDDDAMDRINDELARARPGALAAREGMVLTP